ncbi:MAG: hypothetical protein AAF725_18215 [Acidobacteriota bacterium]
MSLAIELDRAEYRPGETVEGAVRWSGGGAAQSLAISLLWFTEGKGTEDSAVVERRTVDAPGAEGTERFALELPAFPWSASGKLVSIVWAVEASLDPEGEIALARLISSPSAVESWLGQAALTFPSGPENGPGRGKGGG